VDAVGLTLVAVAIAIGIVGVVIPLLPGSLLVFAAIAVWAFVEGTVTAWVTLAVVAVILGASLLVKYLWPARRMKDADVGTWSLVAGGVLGIIGFFVVPVLGLVLGFVLGIYLAELAHRRNQRLAWASTVHAIKGVVLSVGVELTGALLATVVWVVGVLVG
jgi:uncharacterized protein YqgC (DUF456 family)